MAEYRIICGVRGQEGRLERLGYSENGNEVMYDDLWTLAQARQAIEHGHQLYTLNPLTGARTDLEPYEDGLRCRPGQSDANCLEDLPACG